MDQHQQQPKGLVAAAPNESSSSSSSAPADLSMFSSEMILMNNDLGRPSHNHVAAVEDGQTATSITTSTPTNNAIPTKKSTVPPKPPSSSKNAARAVASTSSPRSTKRKKKSEFRKAPQAPRRFKSPYILFSISKMAEYKNQKQQQPPVTSSNNNKSNNKHVNVTSISRRIADEWKTLSKSEREKWDAVAKQDRIRYDVEKKYYTGPWHIPSKRRRKDPTAPKRPASAFLFFCQNQRRKLKEANPELKNTDISKLLGEAWKKAPQHIKQPHIDREQTERELYKTKINEWRAQKNSELESERQHRIAIANQYVIQHGGGGGETNVDNLPPSSSTSSSTMHVPQPCTSTSTNTTAAAAASTKAAANTSTTPAAKNGAAPTLIHSAPPPTDMKKPPQKPPPSVNHQHNSSPWELGGILAGISSTTSTTTPSLASAAAAAVAFQPNAVISSATTTSTTPSSAAAAAVPTEAAPANCTSTPVPPAPCTTTDMKKFLIKHPPASNHHQILPQWELGGSLAGIPAIATNATSTPHLTVPHIPLPLPPFMQQYYGILPSMLTSSIPINMNATNSIEGQTTRLQPPPPPHVSATTSFLPQYHLKLPTPLPPPSLLPPPQQEEKLPTTFAALPQALQKATNDPVLAARRAAITAAAARMYEHPPDEVATTTPRSVVAATVPTDNVGSYSQSTASVPAQQPQSVAPSLSATTNSVIKTDHDTISAANAGAADPYIALSVASQTTAASSNPVEEFETLLQSQPYRALEMQATPSYAALITNSCSSTNTVQTTARGMVAEAEDNDDDELQHDPELQDLQEDPSLSFTATTHTKQPSQLLANKSSSFAPKPLDSDYSDEPSSGHHWFGLFNEASGSSSFDMPLLEEAAQILERSSSANGGGGDGGSPNNTTG